VVVDCHVPLGERKADKTAQEAVLKEIARRALDGAGKHMAPGLFNLVIQFTGFDPHTFKHNIEKLIDFSGQRPEISREDITSVLKRTKSDPIYELTNAVAERNARSALFYIQTLIDNDYHPLQILAAVTNQIRRLLVAKEFARSEYGRNWRKGLSYPQFQQGVMPEIQRYDASVAQARREWRGSSGEEDPAPGKKKAGKSAAMELALAPNPGNAYPVYQTLLKSENFTRRELLDAMARSGETDTRLKSSGQDPTLVVKHLVMGICS
jgi:DNA polymerase-3 subunit delta